MRATSDRSFLDTPAARLLAVLVALICALALVWINRDALFGAGETAASAANPALAACLEDRVGAVDRMRAEGVVNERQYTEFRARAEAFCQGQFPGE